MLYLFRKYIADLLAYPFGREGPYLADLDPGRFRKIGTPDLNGEGEARPLGLAGEGKGDDRT